ncbi:MAG: hypothetical protein QOE80_290 [Actinomycetota bacterium]|nr:hypothetical protein [Actinomycetota bacterium]
MAILALVPLGTGAGAGTDFVAGSGRARASLFEILPRTGGLTIPVNFGKALVTYQGLSATATSGGVKPPSQNSADGGCGGGFQPPGGGGGNPGGGAPAPPSPGGGKGPSTSFPFVSTVSVSTGDKDAEKGRQTDQGSFPDGSPVTGRFEHQEVSANADPSARAATTGGRLGFGPVAEIVQGRTEASTGVVGGRAREAHAVTTIDRLDLLGGMITLVDLRWEATQRTGEGERADGAFTVGSVLLQGKPLPAPPTLPTVPGSNGSPLPDPLVALNTALAPSGIALVAPHFESVGGIVQVSPMSLRFSDSALGRVVLGPIVGALQPLRDPIVGGLLAASCDFGTAVTVADVAAGVLTGSGGISFDFGGVTATTEGEQYDNPLAGGLGDTGDLSDGGGGDLGALPDIGPEPAPATALSGPAVDSGLPGATTAEPGLPTGDGLSGPSGGGSGSGSRPALGAAPSGDEAAFANPGALGSASRHLPGHKGGRAVAVAALALIAVAALAAADALHLHRASRSIS